MSNIAIFCPPLPGHLHPAAVLGRALIAKGHRVTVFQFAEFREQVEAQGLDFFALGQPGNSLSARISEMGHAKDLRSLQPAVEGARQSAENVCTNAPSALAALSIDLVLVDQNEPAGGTVAEFLKLPFVNWPYSPSG